MTPQEIARIYVDIVRLEASLGPDEGQAKQEIAALRSRYHDQLTDTFRQAGIACADRFETARKAFELVADPSRI